MTERWSWLSLLPRKMPRCQFMHFQAFRPHAHLILHPAHSLKTLNTNVYVLGWEGPEPMFVFEGTLLLHYHIIPEMQIFNMKMVNCVQVSSSVGAAAVRRRRRRRCWRAGRWTSPTWSEERRGTPSSSSVSHMTPKWTNEVATKLSLTVHCGYLLVLCEPDL